MPRHSFRAWTLTALPALGSAAAVGLGALACISDAAAPGPQPAIRFSVRILELGESRAGTVALRNEGTAPAASLTFAAGPVTDSAGAAVPGARLEVAPPQLSSLEPGRFVILGVRVELTTPLDPGAYGATLEARAEGVAADSLAVTFRVPAPRPPPGPSVKITAGPDSVRQGDVVSYAAEARDSAGAPEDPASLRWAIVPPDAGLLTQEARFVAYTPGTVKVIASTGRAADTLEVRVTPRGLSGSFSIVGHARHGLRFTSDLWVHGNHAYTGTWGRRVVDSVAYVGDRLFAFDVSNPAAPALTDSVSLDARTVNDVKVRTDGALAVATHEGSSDNRNGITLLDLADPAHPRVITRFTEGLEAGVHNVWIEGTFVYAVANRDGLRIIDIANPAAPHTVASYYGGSSFLHDVSVRDGLAFLSHWDAGLIILDVGHGIAGGSPTAPREVSRIATDGGHTHNAWYWPAGGYVFVGEENVQRPGFMHVVDVRDLRNPKEVATFRVPGATPHNFWMDEERAILYLAWYENGVRALDVSGELLGALDRQGREIAFSRYAGEGPCFSGRGTCTWAPQLHRGLVFVSDPNVGLWVLRPEF